MANEKMMKLAADTVRLLSADAIQKAKSGHPGMPMGCADFAFDLWFNHMKHNPRNPNWLGRDRRTRFHAHLQSASSFRLWTFHG